MSWAKTRQITGRYGRWTVIGFHGRDARGKDFWDCRCDCGTVKAVRGDQLLRGESLSCGCLSREVAVEVARKTGKANVKHGGEKTRLYHIWRKMIERCYNPHHVHYHNYGGRGITICDEWRYSFASFRDWAMAHGYTDTLTIDRIDSDKGYCPANCRWATPLEQARNRRGCLLIEGKCLSEWAQYAEVSAGSIKKRLEKGWTIQEAVAVPRYGERHAS
nr:MAG TPA: PVL ORF-50-like family [Caudoviricetes sp.]